MLIGGVTYLLTNIGWSYIGNVFFGEWLYFFGLFFSMSCFLLISIKYFKNKSFLFYIISDFFWNLSLTKLFTQCFLNPLKFQVSEWWGLVICLLILLIRVLKKK